MDRPILNPGLVPDDPPRSSSSSRKVLLLRAWLRNAARLLWRMITYNPLRSASVRVRIEDGTYCQRVLRGVMYRLAFVPILAALS
ncbi:MAG: hypothetical protein NZ561_06670, partial [Phycisphaerae bacterium]|nr:hypothetical protein [Phycisphaerae bacterium]MDW8262714.1 hypothetical protein [Phycisphaerales bacterium]